MASVPAFCDDPACGAVWSTSAIGGMASRATLIGNKVGPCPACGGLGSVPDGVYDLVNDTLRVVTSATQGLSAEALQQLIDSVRKAAAGGESPEAFAARVAQSSPELIPAVHVFVEHARGQSWTQWLTVWLAVLALILGYLQWQHPKGQPAAAAPPQSAQSVGELDVDKIADEVAEMLQEQTASLGGKMAKHINETIRITDLATTGPVISDHDFENCAIYGPAILAPRQSATISGCMFSGQPDEILWPLPQSASGIVIGAIALVNCRFERCRFEGIGFTGEPEVLEMFRGGIAAP